MKIEYNKIAMTNMLEETAQLAALVQLASSQLRMMWKEESGKAVAFMSHYQVHSLLELIDGKLLDRHESMMDDIKRAA